MIGVPCIGYLGGVAGGSLGSGAIKRTIPEGLLGFPVVQIGVADWGPMYGYLGGVAGGYLGSGAIEGLYLKDC